MREASARRGVDYRPNCTVDSITSDAGGFRLKGAFGEIAAGKVVLGANNGATAFQIDPGETGALFDPGDADTLGMALAWATALAPEKRAELENNAMVHAFRTFKRDETARQIFDIYDELLA